VAHARKISGEAQEALLKVQNKITAAKLGISTENMVERPTYAVINRRLTNRQGEASAQKENNETTTVSWPLRQKRNFLRDMLAYKLSLEAADPLLKGSVRKTSEVIVPVEKV
jgi:hypothetical protein